MGRKKLTNERFQIRCHPKVIYNVRKYAKEESDKYVHQIQKDAIEEDKKAKSLT